MKTLVLSAAILALAATAWAEEAKTDSAKAPEAAVLRRLPPLDASKIQVRTQLPDEPKELADVEHGVYVHIINEKAKKGPECFWKEMEIIESCAYPGIKWFQTARIETERVVLKRIRLTSDTFSYLIASPDADPGLRWIALRDIYNVDGFADGERLRLIELASRDKSAWLRYMAVLKAAEYQMRCAAVPILCRALCDSDILVSHPACDPLADYFFPTRDDGFPRVKTYTGSGVDLAMHEEVVATARKVHKIRPDLVTDEDLATIDALRDSRMPNAMKQPEKTPETRSEAKPPEKPEAKSP